tara:strand:- start:109 stop:363 length:255 start_codon:yes stop_codon:yes gene_type:complete
MGYNIEKFKEELTELRRKKEQGSIYDYDLGRLVMAECIEKLIIPVVSHRREQLLDFWMKLPKTHKHKGVAEHYIDNYLKSNNCG